MSEIEAGLTMNVFLALIATILSCIFIHLIYNIILGNRKSETQDETASDVVEGVAPTSESVTEIRPSGKNKKRGTWKQKTEFSHPWLLKSLKGHPGNILMVDFSANGKFMAATCDDGSVLLWDVRDLSSKEHRSIRVNIDFDYASHIAWSPDSKGFVVHTVQENHIMGYKVEKKKDVIASVVQAISFDKVHHEEVVGFGISSNGKFLMSCSSKTDMIIYDLKGQILERIDTYLMTTHSAKISPCGHFVVATGFSPDVKVMEVRFTRNGDFKQVAKAFELTGHNSGVYDVAFTPDTSHIATISKDGTWKLFHTNINYALGESPHVLETGYYNIGFNPPRIALSPNAEVLAVTCDTNVSFYDTYTGNHFGTVENVYSSPINYISFDSSGLYLFVCGERAVRILHNVCGYSTTIDTCTRLLATKQTSATVERLKKAIQECREKLAKFNN